MSNDPSVQPGPAWSYSQLKNAETCLKRWFHYNVEKDVSEPETEQLRAGNALHSHFEQRLAHGTTLPLGYGMFEGILAKIVAAPGQLYTEQKLAITGAFQPSTYFARNVWFRTVVDCAVVKGDQAAVFDWKTGKPNEDHTQLQLMAATMFIHTPALQRVRAALMFVNAGESSSAYFLREDMPELWAEILPRVRVMQKARATQEYPPKPSGLCKKYCAVSSCQYYGRGR